MAEEALEEEKTTFSFDGAFQTKIAALSIRDGEFARRTEGLILPEYFDNEAEAHLVDMAQRYYQRYGRVPDTVTMITVVKDEFEKKRGIREDLKPEIKEKLKEVLKADLSDAEFVVDKVAGFAKTQALVQTFEECLELFNKGDYDPIGEKFKKALEVGASEDAGEYDYFEKIAQRTAVRKDIRDGKLKPNGITTGVAKLDALLYHRGWGRKELSLLMGGPKAGKTAAMIGFARSAASVGHNVLYVSLEVSVDIIADRMDSAISDVEYKKLKEHPIEISDKIADFHSRCGLLKLREFPSGTMAPRDLRRLLSAYKSKGIKFDLVVVDYADLMKPDFRTTDKIENSKSIYTDLRAVAQEFDLALLTATQTNREGTKEMTAGMEHVSDDFNKVRIADVFITINKNEEEAATGQARLYIAASRNSEQGKTLIIKQDMSRMKFLTAILGIE